MRTVPRSAGPQERRDHRLRLPFFVPRLVTGYLCYMLLRLFLAFTIIPLLELALLIRVGGWLGLGPTLALVLVTGIVGAWLARREGTRALRAIQAEAASGRLPGDELLHGFLILIAGVVLITPGVLTDLAGILLLVRPIRGGVVERLKRSLAGRVQVATVPHFGVAPGQSDEPPGRSTDGGRIIEI